MKKTIFAVVGIAILAGGILTVNAQTNVALQNQIRADILSGKTPRLDISKVSVEEFTQAYIDLAKSSGVDFVEAQKRKDYNLYRLVRAAEIKKGSAVLLSENLKAEQANSAKDL